MREEFLKSFVYELIKNSYKPQQIQIQENILEPSFKPKISPMMPSLMSTIGKPQIPQMNIGLPPFQLPQLKPGQLPESINLGKLSNILKDPAVFSVECTGAGKNVLVNRAGAVLSSAIILSQQEIHDILTEFSEKTRIPLNTGVFRAIFQDILITAVISEFVGTRFVLQKRTPFQKF